MKNNKFVEFCVLQEKMSAEGNFDTYNKLHKKISKITDELKQNKEYSLFKKMILESDNNNVKLWSASSLLSSKIKEDLKIGLDELTRISKLDGINKLSAKTIIDMWNKGMI